METKPVIVEQILNTSSENVWKAITNRELMKKWFFDIGSFEAKTGFEFRFEGHSEQRLYSHICTITEVIPVKKLEFSWQYDGFEGLSYVSFELFPKGESTLFRLIHRGLESFPQDNPDFSKKSFTEGWTHIVTKSLAGFLENVKIT